MKGLLIALFLIVSASFVFAQDAVTATNSVEVASTTASVSVALPTISTDGNIKEVITMGVELAKHYNELGVWGIMAFVVVILLSLLNNGLIKSIKGFTEEWKHLSNLILSALLAFSSAMYFGGNWVSVLISTLVISGTATAIYKALVQMGILKKKVKN